MATHVRDKTHTPVSTYVANISTYILTNSTLVLLNKKCVCLGGAYIVT